MLLCPPLNHTLPVVHNVKPEIIADSKLNNIPIKIKNYIYILCGLNFILLNFGLGSKIQIELMKIIENTTDYFFAFSTYIIDYFIIASIPAIGIILNSKREHFKISELIMDIIMISIFTLITFGIGLYLMIFFGEPTNPLIPKTIIIEPFKLYTTITLLMGVLISFLFLSRKEKNKIDWKK